MRRYVCYRPCTSTLACKIIIFFCRVVPFSREQCYEFCCFLFLHVPEYMLYKLIEGLNSEVIWRVVAWNQCKKTLILNVSLKFKTIISTIIISTILLNSSKNSGWKKTVGVQKKEYKYEHFSVGFGNCLRPLKRNKV